MTQKNGNMVKWAGILITIILTLITYIGYAKVLAYRVEQNDIRDKEEHSKLEDYAKMNRENILKMQSDIAYIKQGVDEIKTQVKNKP